MGFGSTHLRIGKKWAYSIQHTIHGRQSCLLRVGSSARTWVASRRGARAAHSQGQGAGRQIEQVLCRWLLSFVRRTFWQVEVDTLVLLIFIVYTLVGRVCESVTEEAWSNGRERFE